jgi:PIN domain nuclease of toxin-antitoxin system
VKLLLDTHVVYWVLAEPNKLPPSHLTAIAAASAVLVSAASAWEIATKVRLGKWPGAARLLPDFLGKVRAAGCEPLDLTFFQAELAGGLSAAHKDPFDRMLAAQSIDLDVQIATVDPVFMSLGCKVV